MLKSFFKFLGITTPQHAGRVKFKISVLYAFLGWNCFAVCLYSLIKSRLPEDRAERRAFYQQKLVGTSRQAHVLQITGLTVTDDFIMTKNEISVDTEGDEVKIDENL